MEIVFKIGEWCASKIFDKVFEKLMENGIERCKSEFGVDPRVLEKALPMIQAMADAAESGMIMQDGGPLKEWLSQIVNIAGEAENVLDEIEYHTLKEKVEMGNKHKVSKTALIASPSTELAKRAFCKGSTSERLKKVIKEINEVVAKADLFINLVDIRKQRQEQQKPSSINNRETSSFLSTEVFGREKEKEDLIRKLLNSSKSDDNKFSILPIVGVGGVGKTTLAKLVYNDEKVIVKHFPLKMWVCVSDCFDVTLLTKKMLDDPNSLSLAALQEKLKEKVKSKRFLLVLDDVWYDEDNCGNKWSELFAPLRYAASGSMIVLTTRKETVVAKLPMSSLELKFLKGIEKEKYWELFKVCAFGDRNPDDYNDLQCIGQEIAKKLKGSPLAAKTIGGILRDDLSPEHWKNILEKDMWAVKQGENDIMPTLRLSYQYLDAHLKPCFRYCGIFPQDHIFQKEKLVHMWIAVGLVQQPKNDNRRLEDIGEEYLDSLVRKSFFDYDNIFKNYVMHDLMHELAKAVSVGECSSVDTTGDNLKMVPDTVRHLSINIIANHLISPVTSRLRNLRTLILIIDAKDPHLPTVIGELLQGLKSLRILDFIDVGKYYPKITIGQIHNNISELIHLRYLDATFVDIMQILSLRLYQLQVLVIPKVEEGKKLDWANNLISLRHLIIDKDATNMIPNIGKLTSLQELKRFCVQKESGYKMNQLKNMNELRELGICNLENVESYEEATEANFKGKVHLNCLSLAWNNYHEQADRLQNFEERVVNHLQPPKKLKELVIDGYSGASFPCWLTIEYASNLVSISLGNCKRWDSLPPFEKLPLLKYLWINKMSAVKTLGFPTDWKDDEVCDFPSRQVQDLFEMPEKREELWNTEEGIKQWKWFQSLSVLRISNCRNMKRMPRLPLRLTQLDIHNNEALICLPELYPLTLHRLSIRDCPKLTSLPHGLLWNPERFTALEELRIVRTTNLIQLPVGGFSKLVNLRFLTIEECPKLERSSTSVMESKRLLPSSLQYFSMDGRCGSINLEASLLESLNGLASLNYLVIRGCNNITALPPVDDFKSLISLISLRIWDCRELVSLGGLQANVSLDELVIIGCDKLLESVDQFIPTNWRNEVEDSSSSTKADSTPLIEDSTLSLKILKIDSPLLLQTKQLQSAKVRWLIIEPCSDQLLSLPEQWLMQNCNSLEGLEVKGAKALQSLPATLQTLCSLKAFYLTGATDLQSLPKMPPSLDSLEIFDCNPLLKKRCEKDVGPDWPNIAHVRCIKWD